MVDPKQALKEQHIEEFVLTDSEGNDLQPDCAEDVYQKAVKKAIRDEINSHGPLIDTDEIIEEVQRLRECRQKFTRKYEHVLYTRYSNRIGELKISLEALGVPFPKPTRYRKSTASVPKKSLYVIYTEMFKVGKITGEQYIHYTRKDGGVRPTPEERPEHLKLIALASQQKKN